MTMLILDRNVQARLEIERRADGSDKHDEVWDGVTVVMPLPTDEHQEIATGLATVMNMALGWPNPHKIRSGVNVSDRAADWMKNYREPDVVVYLESTSAVNYDTHWQGGPDFLIEIVSPDDRSRDKLPFYASINSREVLIIDRDPWRLEQYELQNGKLIMTEQGDLQNPKWVVSNVLPFSFRLIAGSTRPSIELKHNVTGQSWIV